ncbi:hypothetical protein, partial [Neisseria sp. P0009.S007]|uniref:hypothetical protein n=1 Tax=Neisseria sp. P0009.S007 TaxID=3436714 RepID=UPI003F81BD94
RSTRFAQYRLRQYEKRSSENRFRRPLDQAQNPSAGFICESPYCSAASLYLLGYGSRFGVADDQRTDTL